LTPRRVSDRLRLSGRPVFLRESLDVGAEVDEPATSIDIVREVVEPAPLLGFDLNPTLGHADDFRGLARSDELFCRSFHSYGAV